MDLNMCNDWMTASICVFLWMGATRLGSDIIPHWELQLGLAQQIQRKALLLLVQLYQRHGHIGPNTLLTTPSFHILFEVQSRNY
jgi:hypothetical protein